MLVASCMEVLEGEDRMIGPGEETPLHPRLEGRITHQTRGHGHGNKAGLYDKKQYSS